MHFQVPGLDFEKLTGCLTLNNDLTACQLEDQHKARQAIANVNVLFFLVLINFNAFCSYKSC